MLEARRNDTKVYVVRTWSAWFDSANRVPEYTKEHHDMKLSIFDIPELQHILHRGNMSLSSKGGDHLFPMREMVEEFGCIGSISKFNLLGISQEHNRGWKGSTRGVGSPARPNVVALVFLPNTDSLDLISKLPPDLKIVYRTLSEWKRYCESIGVVLFHRLPPRIKSGMDVVVKEGYDHMIRGTRSMLEEQRKQDAQRPPMPGYE